MTRPPRAESSGGCRGWRTPRCARAPCCGWGGTAEDQPHRRGPAAYGELGRLGRARHSGCRLPWPLPKHAAGSWRPSGSPNQLRREASQMPSRSRAATSCPARPGSSTWGRRGAGPRSGATQREQHRWRSRGPREWLYGALVLRAVDRRTTGARLEDEPDVLVSWSGTRTGSTRCWPAPASSASSVAGVAQAGARRAAWVDADGQLAPARWAQRRAGHTDAGCHQAALDAARDDRHPGADSAFFAGRRRLLLLGFAVLAAGARGRLLLHPALHRPRASPWAGSSPSSFRRCPTSSARRSLRCASSRRCWRKGGCRPKNSGSGPTTSFARERAAAAAGRVASRFRAHRGGCLPATPREPRRRIAGCRVVAEFQETPSAQGFRSSSAGRRGPASSVPIATRSAWRSATCSTTR